MIFENFMTRFHSLSCLAHKTRYFQLTQTVSQIIGPRHAQRAFSTLVITCTAIQSAAPPLIASAGDGSLSPLQLMTSVGMHFSQLWGSIVPLYG